MSLKATPSQTVGPFFHLGFDGLTNGSLVPVAVSGKPITLQGCVLDGDSKPVPDAVLEFWQASPDGIYPDMEDTRNKPLTSRFNGFARIYTDENGCFQFVTVKPGRVLDQRKVLHAPHIVVTIFMRGLLKQLITRIYFPDETANADDPVLNLVPVERRSTLVCKRLGGIEDSLEWNVILQGKEETVFFDW
jgi:protocatechuate 3,4-dioxygenase, alpha subunit